MNSCTGLAFKIAVGAELTMVPCSANADERNQRPIKDRGSHSNAFGRSAGEARSRVTSE